MGGSQKTRAELLAEVASLREQLQALSTAYPRTGEPVSNPGPETKSNTAGLGSTQGCVLASDGSGAVARISEALCLRALLEATPDLVIIKDRRSVIVACSASTSQHLGLSATELIGKTDGEIFLPDEVRQFRAEEAQVTSAGLPAIAEHLLRLPAGYRWYEALKMPVRDESGQIIGLLCVERDVTARKQVEEALRQRLALERLIIKFALQFIELRPYEVDDVIEEALSEVGAFVGVDHCYVLALSPDRQRLIAVREWRTEGVGPLLPPFQTADSGPRPWWVQQLQNEPYIYIPRVAEMPQQAESERRDLESQGIRSLLCIPMTHRNEIIGFVGFNWVRTERVWTEDDITTLQMLAIVLANALQHKQAEAALHRYATRLEMLHDIDHAVLALQSSGDIAAAIVRYIRRVIPCQRASIVELDPHSGTGCLLAVDAEGETALRTGEIFNLPPESLPELTSWRTPVVSRDRGQTWWDPTADLLSAEGIHSQIIAPLRFKDELFGLLTLGVKQPETLVPDYLDIVAEVASSLAIALYQSRLFDTARREAEAKATLLQEMNHRVKNNLSAILGLLYTEQRLGRPDGHVDHRSLLRDLINRVRGLATVHSLLSDAEWGPVPLSVLVPTSPIRSSA